MGTLLLTSAGVKGFTFLFLQIKLEAQKLAGFLFACFAIHLGTLAFCEWRNLHMDTSMLETVDDLFSFLLHVYLHVLYVTAVDISLSMRVANWPEETSSCASKQTVDVQKSAG